MHRLQCLSYMVCQQWIRHCKMCKRYEKQFLMFLSGKKVNEENKNREYDKKKLPHQLMHEISSSLQRKLEKAKNVSKELEAQDRFVR